MQSFASLPWACPVHLNNPARIIREIGEERDGCHPLGAAWRPRLGLVKQKDAVIVGARCAGSTLALELARAGLDVLVVDRDTFPSGTISTHLIFPNTLARFEELEA